MHHHGRRYDVRLCNSNILKRQYVKQHEDSHLMLFVSKTCHCQLVSDLSRWINLVDIASRDQTNITIT